MNQSALPNRVRRRTAAWATRLTLLAPVVVLAAAGCHDDFFDDGDSGDVAGLVFAISALVFRIVELVD